MIYTIAVNNRDPLTNKVEQKEGSILDISSGLDTYNKASMCQYHTGTGTITHISDTREAKNCLSFPFMIFPTSPDHKILMKMSLEIVHFTAVTGEMAGKEVRNSCALG